MTKHPKISKNIQTQTQPVADSLQLLPRAARYVVLRATHPGWSRARCAREAGYDKTTPGRQIERCEVARLAAQAIEQQRAALQVVPEASLAGVVARQVAIAVDHRVEPRDRTQADRLTADLLGYRAPQRLDVRGAVLIRDLSALTAADLAALATTDTI